MIKGSCVSESEVETCLCKINEQQHNSAFDWIPNKSNLSICSSKEGMLIGAAVVNHQGVVDVHKNFRTNVKKQYNKKAYIWQYLRKGSKFSIKGY